MSTGGWIERPFARSIGDAVLLSRAKTVWWCAGAEVVGPKGGGSGRWEKWEGFSKWLTAGEKGGQEGKNGLRRFTEGEGKLANAGGGATLATSELPAKRWNNFALSRTGLAARVPS